MTDAITLEAPAKINLSLRVVRRREDGFHEIRTRMAPTGLADRITLTRLPEDAPGTVRFTCDDATIPGDESNLAVRAVRALETFTGSLPAVAVHLEKHIPHGAGLGGGSSDAAAVLTGLNALLDLTLDLPALTTAAASIGSDIPFFLHGSVCDCTGRGEFVFPVPDFTWRPRILLLKPPFSVSTPDAYRRWRDSREIPEFPCAEQPAAAGSLINDLERPVFEKFPVLGTLKSRLLACPGVTGALMSGSGSTVFAILADGADAGPALAVAREEIGAGLWHCETSVR